MRDCQSRLEELDEVYFLFDSIEPLIRSEHHLVQSTHDRGLSRLEMSGLSGHTLPGRVGRIPWRSLGADNQSGITTVPIRDSVVMITRVL